MLQTPCLSVITLQGNDLFSPSFIHKTEILSVLFKSKSVENSTLNPWQFPFRLLLQSTCDISVTCKDKPMKKRTKQKLILTECELQLSRVNTESTWKNSKPKM